MKTLLKTIAISGIASCLLIGGASQSWAQSSVVTEASSSFVKKRYKIKGSWNITQENGQNVLQFNDDFKTKGGPDLKLFISSKPVADLNGDNVVASSRKISILKSKKGAQSYIIPDDIKLSDYKSIIIHCEAYSVLWGGFDLG